MIIPLQLSNMESGPPTILEHNTPLCNAFEEANFIMHTYQGRHNIYPDILLVPPSHYLASLGKGDMLGMRIIVTDQVDSPTAACT